MTEGEVAALIVKDRGIHDDLMIRNCHVCHWESDIIVVTDNWYATEIEIKVTKSDLRAEFASRIEWDGIYCNRDACSTKSIKHDALLNGGYPSLYWHRESERYYLKDRKQQPVKYFIIAVPRDLEELALEIVPDRYGIISIDPCDKVNVPFRVREVRKPKALKGHRKLTEKEMLRAARYCSHRYWTMAIAGNPGGRK